MDSYKKVFKSRKVREFILKLLFFVPTSLMLRIQYKIKLKKWPTFKNPERFTEKIQVYKMKYRNPLMNQCVDKYKVRSYVKSLGLANILTKSYGIYNDFQDIDFNILPEKFVIKSTNGSGGLHVLLCKNKENLNYKEIEQIVNSWKAKTSYRNGGREWAYHNLKTSIFIEEYLEDKNSPNESINDYKIFCFNGKAEYIIVDIDRFTSHKRNIYDVNWKYLDINSDCKTAGNIYQKPPKLLEMIKIAEKLSSEFPFVRVDLYNINGNIFFGEFTFYPWSGYVEFKPDEFDYTLGEKFNHYKKNIK